MGDEAARRRELRRQKILANSESRLRRILNNEEGRASGDEPASPSPPPPEEDAAIIGDHRPALRSEPPPDNKELRLSSENLDERVSFSSLTPSFQQLHSPFNPITDMDFSDIPAEELAFFGSSSDDFDVFRQGIVSQLGNGFPAGQVQTPPFDSVRFAQLFSSLASSSDENSLCTLANLAESFKVPQSHRTEEAGGSCGTDRMLYQILWDPCCVFRILLVVVLAVLARLILPFLPSDYTVMFAPLYFLEILLLSSCIICSVPLDSSKMAVAFNLLLMLGAPQRTVRFGHTLVTCINILFRDLSTYTFAFFMTHALCQHAGMTVA